MANIHDSGESARAVPKFDQESKFGWEPKLYTPKSYPNPTYIQEPLQDIDAAERAGFELAVRTIYILALRHLGKTHPVIEKIRNLKP